MTTREPDIGRAIEATGKARQQLLLLADDAPAEVRTRAHDHILPLVDAALAALGIRIVKTDDPVSGELSGNGD
jgi:hypothetical protein